MCQQFGLHNKTRQIPRTTNNFILPAQSQYTAEQIVEGILEGTGENYEKGRGDVPHILHSLRNRELGRSIGSLSHVTIYDSLVRSQNRKLQITSTRRGPVNATYNNGYILECNKGAVANRHTGFWRAFNLSACGQHKKECYISTENKEKGKIDEYFIILTTYGILLVLDHINRKFPKKYQLPDDSYDFNDLTYSETLQQLTVVGKGKGENKNSALIVFNVVPFRFKMMLTTSINFHPFPINYVIDNAMVCYNKDTKEMHIYDYEELYKQFCFEVVKEVEEHAGIITVEINVECANQARPLATFKTSSKPTDFGFVGQYFFLSKGDLDNRKSYFRRIDNLNKIVKTVNKGVGEWDIAKGEILGGFEHVFIWDSSEISCFEMLNPTSKLDDDLQFEHQWTRLVVPKDRKILINGRHVAVETKGGILVSDDHYVYCATLYELDEEVEEAESVKVFVRPLLLIRILEINSGKLLRTLSVEDPYIESDISNFHLLVENGEICLTTKKGKSSTSMSFFDLMDQTYREEVESCKCPKTDSKGRPCRCTAQCRQQRRKRLGYTLRSHDGLRRSRRNRTQD